MKLIEENDYKKFRHWHEGDFNTEIIKDVAGLVDFYRSKESCDIDQSAKK